MKIESTENEKAKTKVHENEWEVKEMKEEKLLHIFYFMYQNLKDYYWAFVLNS